MRLPNPFTFLKAMLFWVLTTFKTRTALTPDRVAAIRNARCKLCPHYEAFSEHVGQCTICSCITDMKAMVPSESCPDNPPRWKAYQNDKSDGL